MRHFSETRKVYRPWCVIHIVLVADEQNTQVYSCSNKPEIEAVIVGPALRLVSYTSKLTRHGIRMSHSSDFPHH